MSDDRDNAFARLESRIQALEAEVRGLKQREQQREQQRQTYAAAVAETGKDGTLHVPRKVPAWKESA